MGNRMHGVIAGVAALAIGTLGITGSVAARSDSSALALPAVQAVRVAVFDGCTGRRIRTFTGGVRDGRGTSLPAVQRGGTLLVRALDASAGGGALGAITLTVDASGYDSLGLPGAPGVTFSTPPGVAGSAQLRLGDPGDGSGGVVVAGLDVRVALNPSGATCAPPPVPVGAPSLTGRIVDVAAKPPPNGIEVSVGQPGQPSTPLLVTGGSFRSSGALAPGDYSLVVDGPGAEGFTLPFTQSAPQGSPSVAFASPVFAIGLTSAIDQPPVIDSLGVTNDGSVVATAHDPDPFDLILPGGWRSPTPGCSFPAGGVDPITNDAVVAGYQAQFTCVGARPWIFTFSVGDLHGNSVSKTLVL